MTQFWLLEFGVAPRFLEMCAPLMFIVSIILHYIVCASVTIVEYLICIVSIINFLTMCEWFKIEVAGWHKEKLNQASYSTECFRP
jgi:hypothetical protein